MSEQYPGGFITKTNPTVDGSTAKGLWTLSQAAGYAKQGLWPTVPAAPTIGTATAGNTTASVAFTAPSNIGSSAITSYTATSSPGAFTGTGASSPVTVSGLTNGTAYTFTVQATNGAGTGPASAASNSVTPLIPNYVEEVFSTYLYTGNNTNPRTITNGIDLAGKGGLVWTKQRAFTNEPHILVDTVRGSGKNLSSNNTNAQDVTGSLTAFTSSGYTISNQTVVNGLDTYTYASWTFREQPKFFDVVTFTGNSTNGRQIAHNLNGAIGTIIVKNLTNADEWLVWHRGLNDFAGSGNNLVLNTTAAQDTGGYFGVASTQTSTYFTVNANITKMNWSGNNYVAYLFAHNAGGFGLTGTDNVISCGSYTGNAGNTEINLGWEPQWVMIKRTNAIEDWLILDTMRGWVNSGDDVASSGQKDIFPNLSSTEATPAYAGVTPQATGFKVRSGLDALYSANGSTYIYIAIRRGPMRTPTTGTSVFAPVAYTGNGAARTIDTSQPYLDSYIVNRRTTSADNHNWLSRLTGSNALQTNLTLAEGSIGSIAWDSQDLSFTGTNYNTNTSAINYIAWTFARAPGFFDEVCYTGTGVSRTVAHNLAAVPELIIVKNRSAIADWRVYNAAGGSLKSLYLNATPAYDSDSTVWNNTSPTSSVFTVGTNSNVNVSGNNYVSYLFATLAGVSKVGSYTGTSALQTVACGFTSGARFVLIKRTDSTGDWYVWDSARGISSGTDPYLLINSDAAEVTATNYVDTDTTGFKVTAAAPAGLNAVGGTYIFLAIA